MKFFNKLFATIFLPWKRFQERMPLASFITGRIFTMLILLFLLGFALFALMALAPGDIVDQMMTQQIMAGAQGDRAGTRASTSDNNFQEEQMAALRAELGIDKPFYVQYAKWLKRVIVHHDLGVSLISRAPVGFFDSLADLEFSLAEFDFARADYDLEFRARRLFFEQGRNKA